MPRTAYVTCAAALLMAAGGACAATPHYAPRSTATTYYVSARGDDGSSGTSPGTAWKSLARAERAVLHPGDRLLLEGGSRFTGTITLGTDEAGNAERPVIVGSYGSGRATITATDSPAVSVHNTAGVEIRDLTLTGRGTARTKDAGINLYADLPDGGRHNGVRISGVDLSGFSVGIGIGATKAQGGFENVTVEQARLHDNKDAGLLTYGPAFDPRRRAYPHQNIDIKDVVAYHNQGDPTASDRHTGDGIVLGGVRHATLDNSSAHDNGGRSAADATAGPVGIWAYDSADVLIEHSTSYRNHTGSDVDGAGFGFDSNVSGSTIQYNLSFQNDGSGYYVFSRNRNGTHSDNTIRYNISGDDARKLPLHGALTIYGKDIRNLDVYQNTVIMSRTPAGSGPAVLLRPGNTGVSLRNNLLATAGDPLISADTSLSAGQVVLQGNLYDTPRGQWTVDWGKDRFTDLASWRAATGQERVRGKAVGITADPCFAGGRLPEITAPGDAHRLTPGCPRDGLDLRELFGTDPGAADHFGRQVGNPPAIGAVEP
ncbi:MULTISPECIES: right-handed parallel beta-helix repeat-containing protein [unclassified Streptomyces]|uniref:right-handed parallel beta-helix repeat-containing protein n=1 Tax=unclassified Streptomyces TaxID=2593676 RepID=UPI00324E5322